MINLDEIDRDPWPTYPVAKKDLRQLNELVTKLINRVSALEAALQFYRDGFRYHVKRTSMGINLSEWKPTEELLNDCGETARSVLAGERQDG